MSLPALRSKGILRSVLFVRHALPHTQRGLQHQIHESRLSHKRYLYNVAGPRYHTHCTGCGIYHLWDPEEDGQFFCKGFLREDLAEYRSGGYHPVHLGDTLHGERYKIVQKLGWGRDATVWLAEDRRLSRQVAIKFYRSDRRHDEKEARILRRLTEGPTGRAGKGHVMQLLDQFELKGPNGRHLCLVVEALGPRVKPCKLSPEAAWEVARQLVEATAYFHDLGIAHGDLRRDRILFTNTSLLHRNGNPSEPLKMPKIGNVRSVDEFGNVESILGQCLTARVPRYLVKSLQQFPQSLSYDAVDGLRVKVIGFGQSFPAGKLQGVNYDFHYRAPELVFDSQLTPSADIWSLGCLICELICGEHLFNVWWETEDDQEGIVEEWISTFGELPEEWKIHSPPTASDPDLVTPGEYNILHRLHTELSLTRPGTKWFSKADLDSLGDLINSMTQYRPSDRPSAAEVLKHPWFQHCPTLVPVKGLSKAQEALEDLEKLKALKLDSKTVISRNFLDRWYKRG